MILPRLGVAARAAAARRRAGSPARPPHVACGSPAPLPATREAAVGIVLAARGYPGTPRARRPDRRDRRCARAGALVFHAGTDGRRDRRLRGRTAAACSRSSGGERPRRGPDDRRRGRGRDHLGRLQRRRDIAAVLPETLAAHRAAGRGARRVIRRYTLPEMGAVWSEQARFERMLEVEIAVCRAQVRRGLVPAEALAAIEAAGRRSTSTGSPRSRRRPTTTSSRSCPRSPRRSGPEGRYLHLGLTSSDVVDTALALQLRAAGERLLGRRGPPRDRAHRPGPPGGRHA